jgi:hypothetical protein
MLNRDKIWAVMDEIAKSAVKEVTPYVIICQPRRDLKEMPAQQFNGRTIHVSTDGYSHAFEAVGGLAVDVARNTLIEDAIASGAKYLFFIGEDTVVPWYAFDVLHKTAEANPDAMVVGVYRVKISGTPLIGLDDYSFMLTSVDAKNEFINTDPGQIISLASSGLDCALIPIALLKALRDDDLEIPLCCIGVNGKSWIPANKSVTPDKLPAIGEDHFFCFRWKQAGFEILCNTDVQCLHVDLASGKYTAHPGVNLEDYQTLIKITEPLTYADKANIDKRYTRPLGGSAPVEERPSISSDFKDESISSILKELGDDTDKVTVHSYGPAYDAIFSLFRRDMPLAILELGVKYGASLVAWKRYFPFSCVVGVDIKDERKPEYIQPDVYFEQQDLRDFVNKEFRALYDIIIDDSSHAIEDILFIIDRYTDSLNENGILIIEDVQPTDANLALIQSAVKAKGASFDIEGHDLRASGRFDDYIVVIKKKTTVQRKSFLQ